MPGQSSRYTAVNLLSQNANVSVICLSLLLSSLKWPFSLEQCFEKWFAIAAHSRWVSCLPHIITPSCLWMWTGLISGREANKFVFDIDAVDPQKGKAGKFQSGKFPSDLTHLLKKSRQSTWRENRCTKNIRRFGAPIIPDCNVPTTNFKTSFCCSWNKQFIFYPREPFTELGSLPRHIHLPLNSNRTSQPFHNLQVTDFLTLVIDSHIRATEKLCFWKETSFTGAVSSNISVKFRMKQLMLKPLICKP